MLTKRLLCSVVGRFHIWMKSKGEPILKAILYLVDELFHLFAGVFFSGSSGVVTAPRISALSFVLSCYYRNMPSFGQSGSVATPHQDIYLLIWFCPRSCHSSVPLLLTRLLPFAFLLVLSAVATTTFQAWRGVCIFVDGKSLFKFFYAGFEDFILLFKQSILFFKLFDDFNLIIAHLSPPSDKEIVTHQK